MPVASTLSVIFTAIGLLLVAYAVFLFASAMVARARRRDDRAARVVSRGRTPGGNPGSPDRSDTRR
ncbi:MAG: hypothetical protein HZB14_01835 [Actinobacteria bacterium]|nr:hypothetical protein [Actinomycetota bacterium]